MVDAKSATGNAETTSSSFLVELSNIERKLASGLLEAEVKDIPSDNMCQEATHNFELAKAWKEVLSHLINLQN